MAVTGEGAASQAAGPALDLGALKSQRLTGHPRRPLAQRRHGAAVAVRGREAMCQSTI
jgi:hypothetical protein